VPLRVGAPGGYLAGPPFSLALLATSQKGRYLSDAISLSKSKSGFILTTPDMKMGGGGGGVCGQRG